MAEEKIAVVTGSNKGIGFEIVKGLCKRFSGKVYLTARDTVKGADAVKKLKSLGYNPLFHQVDIGSQESINKFRDYLKNQHGGIDVLVNNAGIRLLGPDPAGVNATKTIAINYFGTLAVCDSLFPLLRADAKVVNISSSAGHLYRIPSEKLRERFSDPTLTVQQLNELMNKFLDDFKENKLNENGWPNSAYTVSKVGVSALSIIQQKILDNEVPNRNIKVNFIHPGWVKSDMNDKGNITIEEGAKPTLYVILDNDELKGKYIWWDCQVVDWFSPNTPPRPYPVEYQ
ncbi:unnamed protein product [Callosobruchus maculatus]|uniref:carbonyl reductase (NADPH) n=1 Tax=Callosobruchus maculatus TaxID=64391 RepID=A0A653C5C1_CALMS|nr:unnamed protein product [Callosobruchus maculatus]